MFKASFKFVPRALLIGMIALKKGIKIPIPRAYKVAFDDGKGVGWKPISSVKRSEYIPQMHGSETMKPATSDGNTKQAACVKIIPTKPVLLRPIRRMIPMSKVFVSTEIIRSE